MDLAITLSSSLITVLILFLNSQDNSSNALTHSQKNINDFQDNKLRIELLIWLLCITFLGLLLIKAKIQQSL
uniref:Protein-export membrane protein SecG n=1 Tax=Cyanidium caldarium TaxID=2771 RepID=Q9TLR4_CYACA|nr:hypothetical protein JXY51_pgp016 [Cyanidium caldarium]AAF12889.1 unknown [Cyanidium caldarium]